MTIDTQAFHPSVIITSYNQKDYLLECIESVLNQTHKLHEIIIADDASVDGSIELIRHYTHQHPEWIKGIFQESNVGITLNRNAALAQVTGDHVAILDGDDRYLPHNIEFQLRALARNPEAGCAYSNLYYIDSKGIRTGLRDKQPRSSGWLLSYLADGKMGLLRSMLMRYDLLKKAGFLDVRFPKHDGFILTLKLAKESPFIYVPEPLTEYRVHEQGDSRSFSGLDRYDYLNAVYQKVLELIKDLPPDQMERIHAQWFWRLLYRRMQAEREQGAPGKALMLFLKTFIQNPGRIRHLLHLWR